jgi:hypothetical protein
MRPREQCKDESRRAGKFWLEEKIRDISPRHTEINRSCRSKRSVHGSARRLLMLWGRREDGRVAATRAMQSRIAQLSPTNGPKNPPKDSLSLRLTSDAAAEQMRPYGWMDGWGWMGGDGWVGTGGGTLLCASQTQSVRQKILALPVGSKKKKREKRGRKKEKKETESTHTNQCRGSGARGSRSNGCVGGMDW